MSQSASPDAFRRESAGPLNGQEEEALRGKRIVRSYIACKRCHTQKVKCSGETPCRNCKGSKTPVDCIYPVRDRKVAVSERYLKKLEGENQSLKRKSPHHEPAQKRFAAGRAVSTHESDTFSPPGQSIVSEEDDLDVDETHIQPYVGEAACTTFGTKLRRFLRGDDQAGSSRPRYYKNQRMLRASCTDCQLPNRSDAQLLVRVVLRFIGPDYHLLRRTSFLERLEETYKLEVLNDPIWLCRLFTVFALGEIYTVRSTKPSGNGVPGIAFFLKALDFFQDLYEEPTVEYIETLLLLSFYSTTLNRRNTAYTYIGLAMRLSMMLGLHRKIPESSPLSAAERQHRIRVWWTVYCLDRMMSSKLGHPAMMQDTDIDADLPSLDGLSPKDSADFYDPAYLLASISLARIVENVLGNIYHIPQPGRANTFVQGVQTIFTSLRNFQSGLPPMLRLEPCNTPMYANRSVASLHLHFNQCVILTTRPILFYVFRQRFNQTGGPGSEKPHPLPHIICALSDACIQAARSSNQILSQLWVDGCLAMYGFYDALSIFSSTMVLMLSSAMSGIEGKTSPDRDGIGLAWSLLRSMKDDGNVPAGDYYDQLAQLKEALYEACAKKSKALGEPAALPPLETSSLQISAAASGMDSRPGLPEPRHGSTTGPLSHLVVAHKEDRNHLHNTDVFDNNNNNNNNNNSNNNNSNNSNNNNSNNNNINNSIINPFVNGLWPQAGGGQPQSEAQMLDAMFSANGTDQLLWDFDWDSVGML